MNSSDSLLLLADAKPWPTGSIRPSIAWYVAIAFGVPILGYVFMVLDYRAYLRSLRRAIMVVTSYRTELPEWMRKNTPRCISRWAW